jgi:hypothetical protein
MEILPACWRDFFDQGGEHPASPVRSAQVGEISIGSLIEQ